MLDFEGVRRLLPQGYPFIFVDRVLDFEANRRIVCLKNVTGTEPFFPGHFPEVAIMPGALMGEAIAQASILLFRLSVGGPAHPPPPPPPPTGGSSWSGRPEPASFIPSFPATP